MGDILKRDQKQVTLSNFKEIERMLRNYGYMHITESKDFWKYKKDIDLVKRFNKKRKDMLEIIRSLIKRVKSEKSKSFVIKL